MMMMVMIITIIIIIIMPVDAGKFVALKGPLCQIYLFTVPLVWNGHYLFAPSCRFDGSHAYINLMISLSNHADNEDGGSKLLRNFGNKVH